jgi:hypothetical protein
MPDTYNRHDFVQYENVVRSAGVVSAVVVFAQSGSKSLEADQQISGNLGVRDLKVRFKAVIDQRVRGGRRCKSNNV